MEEQIAVSPDHVGAPHYAVPHTTFDPHTTLLPHTTFGPHTTFVPSANSSVPAEVNTRAGEAALAPLGADGRAGQGVGDIQIPRADGENVILRLVRDAGCRVRVTAGRGEGRLVRRQHQPRLHLIRRERRVLLYQAAPPPR